MKGENREDVHILNVRLPEDILAWLDALVESGAFNSRSEVVREIIRDYLKHD